MRLPRIAACLGLAVTFGAASAVAWAASSTAASARPSTASAAPTLTIYLAPSNKGGSDKHTGLSSKSPILTLAEAQKILGAKDPKGNVIIRIDQGTYVAAQTNWSFYVPGHTVAFMPANYVVGHGRPAGGDPVFVDSGSGAHHTAGWWLDATRPSAASSPLHDGGNAGLQFYYLQIEDYTNGISLDGHASINSAGWWYQTGKGLNDNYVSGMTFYDIGNAYAGGQIGYAAILLTNSSHNTITNNTFQDIYNISANASQVHGLYVTHFSSSNSITKNKFEDLGAEAVKIRDRSNDNTVNDNRFYSISGVSAYLDEFCDATCIAENPGTGRQCASYDNHFDGNLIDGAAAYTDLIPAGETNAGGGICSIPKGIDRLYASGNSS